jgi:DNA-binding beta-propeller fold protein YncE
VYVADTANNRVALYGTLTTGASAAEILGQLGPTTRLPASSVTDLGHFAGPAGLAFDGANLYVSDRDLSRVLVIHDPKDGGIERSAITGAGYQPTGGIAATKTPFFTSGLYVSDSSNNQIFGVSSVSRLGY